MPVDDDVSPRWLSWDSHTAESGPRSLGSMLDELATSPRTAQFIILRDLRPLRLTRFTTSPRRSHIA